MRYCFIAELLALPSEILLKILKYANHPPVAGVCRRLRQVQCYLYVKYVVYGLRVPQNRADTHFSVSPSPGLLCSTLGSLKFCVNALYVELVIRNYTQFMRMCSILKQCHFKQAVYVPVYCDKEVFIRGRDRLLESVSHLKIMVDCRAVDAEDLYVRHAFTWT